MLTRKLYVLVEPAVIVVVDIAYRILPPVRLVKTSGKINSTDKLFISKSPPFLRTIWRLLPRSPGVTSTGIV